MQVLHITPNTNGYEVVELVANAINKKNSLRLIKKDGVEYMTGGFIITDTPDIRYALDLIPREKQYWFVKDFKIVPFVKLYADEDETK